MNDALHVIMAGILLMGWVAAEWRLWQEPIILTVIDKTMFTGAGALLVGIGWQILWLDWKARKRQWHK